MYKNNGKFYEAYYYDAYILNLLFSYKVINGRKCGFPDTALNKVLEKLEKEKISYKIIYLDKDIVEKDFRKLNKYNEYYNKVNKNLDIKFRVDRIVNRLMEVSEEELKIILGELEECLK